MTSGGKSGANGCMRDERQALIAIAVVGVVVAVVNATSGILEGQGDHWIEPVVWETTSVIILVALAPLVGSAMQRWPLRADNAVRFALTHLALTVPFALTHVAFIYGTREPLYWAFGARYGFFDDGVGRTLLYEWRKDVLVYAAFAATYWVFQTLADRRDAAASPPGDARIEVRDGGATVFLTPGDITHVAAAGNYVEFHTVGRTYLVRGTLASWEARLLALGFARIHRSRLINRAKIAAMRPTASGDMEISLVDGRTLQGSRRYRAQFDAQKPA